MTVARDITIFAVVLASMSWLQACGPDPSPTSRPFTDLGVSNIEVAARYSAYVHKPMHCVPIEDADYRVILAGFGPFNGKSVNTSSLIAMNFARFMNLPHPSILLPRIAPDDADGNIHQDIVTIDGKKVGVCALNTSVIWDLSGAIYLEEANRFRPDLIIMSGMDGGNLHIGTWEHHTENVAKGTAGYEADGSQSLVTPNVSGGTIPILPDGPASIVMSWNAPKLVHDTDPIVRDRLPGFSLQTSPHETPGSYLCNNVSYIVLAGLTGQTMPLAAGKLSVASPGLTSTKAGFFHYPWESPQDPLAVKVWVDVMAQAMKTEMTSSESIR